MYDPAAILMLPSALRGAKRAADSLDHILHLDDVPGLTVALVGSVGAGKTSLARALLGFGATELPALVDRSKRDAIRVPVEYVGASRRRLLIEHGVAGGGSATRWSVARDSNADALDVPSLRRVRAELPDTVLDPWNLRVIDFPSIERPDDLSEELFASDTAILYVVPSRGLAELDVHAIERLRGCAVAIVESIRDDELLPSRSLVDVTDMPALTCPLTIPIIPFRVREKDCVQGAEEREVLRQCLALLRTRSLPMERLQAARAEAGRLQLAIRTDVADELPLVYAARHDAHAVAHFQALSRLLQIHGAASRLMPLDGSLTELRSALDNTLALSPSLRAKQIRAQLRRLHDGYNIEAGSRYTPSAGIDNSEHLDFGVRYVKYREELLGLLHNAPAITANTDGERVDRQAIEELRRKIIDGRIELTLLGRFSSGKSSLINALLGVTVNDRESKLLRTSSGHETATVTRVEYAEHTTLLGVTWINQITIRLLTEASLANTEAYRVHRSEITAFNGWIRSGAVRLDDCVFECIQTDDSRSKHTVGGAAAWRSFESLCAALEFPEVPRDFAYAPSSKMEPMLPRGTCPTAVTVQRFALPVPDSSWRPDLSLDEAMYVLKHTPAIALRVHTLNIGFNHPLLQHATIIDTPGTDSTIPHHRTLTREFVANHESPVIYCFLSTGPGGLEDRRNLDCLKGIRTDQTGLARLFCVITRESAVRPGGHEEVRSEVERNLSLVGIKCQRIYFTEVANDNFNQDFIALKADVARFVEHGQKPKLLSWVAHAIRIARDATTRHEEELADMASEERVRIARHQRLKADLDTLIKLTDEFENSKQWGVVWGEARLAETLRAGTHAVDDILNGLVDRDSFEGIWAPLDEAFGTLNASVPSQVTRVANAIEGKLVSVLAEQLPRRQIARAGATPDVTLFPPGATADGYAQIAWRSVFGRLWGLLDDSSSWHSDVAINRARLEHPWWATRAAGSDLAKSHLRLKIDHMRGELGRLRRDITAEIEQYSRPVSAQRVAEVKLALGRAKDWMARLAALDRRFNDEVGS